jgi:hypothetical protein
MSPQEPSAQAGAKIECDRRCRATPRGLVSDEASVRYELRRSPVAVGVDYEAASSIAVRCSISESIRRLIRSTSSRKAWS